MVCGMSSKIERGKEIEAQGYLLECIREGDTIYTVLLSVSSNGMNRHIMTVIRTEKGVRNISRLIAQALGMKFNNDKNCISISGCGMDMGFSIVYDLGSVLFNAGYSLKQEWL
jgi:hypothetical protein